MEIKTRDVERKMEKYIDLPLGLCYSVAIKE
jgi:hypothetical protein